MNKKSTQLNCFSPPVMVATFIIEASLAIYTVWRYKMTELTRLITATLLTLATFQLAEYFVCTGLGSMTVPWSRVGFVAITALPPLGLHIMHVLAGKPRRRLVKSVYLVMVAFMVFFLLSPGTFTGHKCTGNYVIFQFTPNVTGTYAVYYFTLLLIGIGPGIRWSGELSTQGKKHLKRLKTVQAMIIGYLVFLVPSGLAMAVKPKVRQGIPSVLCGFAIMLALILALYILPKTAPTRNKKLDKT